MTAINIIDHRHDHHLGSNMYWGATIFHLEVGVSAGLEQHPGFGWWVGVSIIAHHHYHCLQFTINLGSLIHTREMDIFIILILILIVIGSY